MKVRHIDIAKEGKLMPCAPDACQECAKKHAPEMPHNQQSLYYQYKFYQQHGRFPTWDDAVAHCAVEVKVAWMKVLAEVMESRKAAKH